MFHEFKCPPKITREMDANDVKTYMGMLSVYNSISESEQGRAMKGMFGK